MHRLFVPECLKRQRYLRSPSSARLAGSTASLGAICCSMDAAILLHDIGRWRVLLQPCCSNHHVFQILTRNEQHSAALPVLRPYCSKACNIKPREKGRPACIRRPSRNPGLTDQVFIESKNSELFLVLRSLSSRKSIASMVPIGLRIRRSTYIFLSSCGSVMSSSLRVPEREISIAGNGRLSDTLGSRIM